MTEDDYMTPEQVRAHVRVMCDFLTERQQAMLSRATDEEIAREAAVKIFGKCYDIGFNESECQAIILRAIKYAKQR